MTTKPLFAHLVGHPASPPEKIILPRPVPAAAELAGLEDWQRSVERYALETTGGGKPQHVLDFRVRAKARISEFPALRWPSDLYIPANADYKNYWFIPCPESHRYGRQWIIPGDGPNQASEADGHVWAYTALNQYTPHAHSEAGVGFVFAPTATLAVYQVQPTLSALGTYRWSISTSFYGGGWIYEWGAIYIAAWNISPVDGSLDLVMPFGLTTVFNDSFLNQGTQAITNVVPAWSPGPISTNLLLEGGKSYLIGVIAAVDITNTWNVPQGKWPDGSDWRTWCTLDLVIPQITIDPTTVYQP
jgi:hypothetical protein